MAEFIESNRGKSLLVFKLFKFSKANTKLDGTTRWKCIDRKCDAIVYTDQTNKICSESENVIHINHGPYTRNLIDRQIINSACKRKAEDDLHCRPKKIVMQEICKNTSSNANIIDVKRISKNIYEKRKKILPAVPKDLAGVHKALEDTKPVTKEGEPFLLFNDIEKHVIIFSCNTNLKLLSEIDSIYMDGTFKFCPRFFTQMFTIHILKNGHYIPIIFCLLLNKSYETYVYTFNKINNLLNELSIQFSPKWVTIDFEMAIHKAVEDVWPNTEIVGCRFHLTQAWWRNVQKFGLSVDYNDMSSEIGQWIRHTFGLLFLDPYEVSECFVNDFMSDCPDDERLKKYCDYLTDNFINEESLFPPQYWAAASGSLARTTNACESFHSFFNQSFYKHTPSIMSWLSILINEVQTDIYIKIRSINIIKTPRDAKNVERQRQNEAYIEDYKNSKICRYKFVKQISYNYKK